MHPIICYSYIVPDDHKRDEFRSGIAMLAGIVFLALIIALSMCIRAGLFPLAQSSEKEQDISLSVIQDTGGSHKTQTESTSSQAGSTQQGNSKGHQLTIAPSSDPSLIQQSRRKVVPVRFEAPVYWFMMTAR